MLEKNFAAVAVVANILAVPLWSEIIFMMTAQRDILLRMKSNSPIGCIFHNVRAHSCAKKVSLTVYRLNDRLNRQVWAQCYLFREKWKEILHLHLISLN